MRSGVAQLTGHRVEFQMTWVQLFCSGPGVKVLLCLPALMFVLLRYLWELLQVVGLRVKPSIK